MKAAHIILLTAILSSCSTGATLRTARTLNQGQTQIMAGWVVGKWANPVVHIAHGITDSLEIEAHYEGLHGSVLPRYQRLDTRLGHSLDFSLVEEVGWPEAGRLLAGGGIIVGCRFGDFEPYISARYRHIFPKSKDRDEFLYGHSEHLKLGCRYLFSKRWFLSAELGPSWIQHDVVIREAAAGTGLQF
jgi:hypothetical protein